MAKLKTTAAEMVAAARARIVEWQAEALLAELPAEDLLMVDLRDIRERQRAGVIPDSLHAPRGMMEFWIDPESPYFKPVFGEDRRFVLYCASGWRSALTAATLTDMGWDCAHLEGGFTAWKEAGGPVESLPPR